MHRILVIGSGGSGKSTYSRKLGTRLNLPVYHLDRLYWKPGWIPSEKERFIQDLIKTCSEPKWIIDGNYISTMELRLEYCDTVVFLDFSRYLCLFRALKRACLTRATARPDMTEGCNEKFDPEFISWIWNFPKSSRPKIIQKLNSLAGKKNIIVFQSSKAAEEFLIKGLPSNS
jgi:adenylate kinase family enzyme